mmetsp:Transcript_28936/g.67291  ORF Transcript_28936/g.67291 Transcript_28936/m.67291 type:complete len:258 (+) Transcript_28936:244-1017(+)
MTQARSSSCALTCAAPVALNLHSRTPPPSLQPAFGRGPSQTATCAVAPAVAVRARWARRRTRPARRPTRVTARPTYSGYSLPCWWPRRTSRRSNPRSHYPHPYPEAMEATATGSPVPPSPPPWSVESHPTTRPLGGNGPTVAPARGLTHASTVEVASSSTRSHGRRARPHPSRESRRSGLRVRPTTRTGGRSSPTSKAAHARCRRPRGRRLCPRALSSWTRPWPGSQTRRRPRGRPVRDVSSLARSAQRAVQSSARK